VPAKQKNKKTREMIMIGLGVFLVITFSFLNSQLPWYLSLAGLGFISLVFVLIKKTYWGLLLVIFFLPFERIGAIEIGQMTVRLSQILLVVTMVLWFFSLAWRRDHTLVKNPLLIPLGIFLAIILLSLSASINLNRSLLVLAFIIFTMSLAFIVPNLIKSKTQVQQGITILIISFVLVTGFGLLQFLGDMSGLPTSLTGLRQLYTKDVLGFTRVQSTAYEPLYFANYLLMPIAILLALYLSGHKAVKSIWLVLLFGLGLVNLILTVSRGAYLAVVFTLLFVGLFYLKKILKPYNIVIFLVAVVVVGWVVVKALGVGGETFTLEKFQGHVSGVFYGASYDERVATIDEAVQAWREHPVLGIGIGSYGPYTASHPAYMPRDGWRIVNNEYIEILSETGLTGLFFFILFIVWLMGRSLQAIKKARDEYLKAIMIGLSAAFVGILVQYLTFSTLYIMHIWFLVGFMIAVQNIILVRRAHSLQTPE